MTQKPDLISFAGGLPAHDVLPLKEFHAAVERVLSKYGNQALQYSVPEGCPGLRELLARQMRRQGVPVKPENILITNGSQQALDLIGKVFLNPGDRIAVERPTYLGALLAWNCYQAEYRGIIMDHQGMRPDGLESALRSNPKFLYVLPNFQNPMGVTLSADRRRLLVDLANRYGVPIVEDDPYLELRFEGETLPSIASLASLARKGGEGPGDVLYLGSFSAMLAPGLRVGWLVAPAEVIQRLVWAKQCADLHTGTFVQLVAEDMVESGFLDAHLEHIRSTYRIRRDAIVNALKKHMPPGVRWTTPQGGLFIWAELPENIDAMALLPEAVEQRVAFVPGSAFFCDESGKNTMRLNFSNANPEKIEEGIRRISEVLCRACIGAP